MVIFLKKCAALLLALSLCLCCGCTVRRVGSGASEESRSNASLVDTRRATVNILPCDAETGRELEKAAAAFMQQYKDVSVHILTLESGQDYDAQLLKRLTNGDDLTVFCIGGQQGMADYEKYLAELSLQNWVYLADDNALQPVTKDGRVYGIPAYVESFGLLANKEILTEAGLDTAKMLRYDGFHQALKELDKKITGGELREKYPSLASCCALPASAPLFLANFFGNTLFQEEFDGDLSAMWKAKEVVLEPETTEPARKMVSTLSDFSVYYQNKGAQTKLDAGKVLEDYLLTGKAAIMPADAQTVSALRKSGLQEDYTLLPTPFLNQEDNPLVTGISMYWAFNQNASQENLSGAGQFFNWLYTSQEGRVYLDSMKWINPFVEESAAQSDSLSRQIRAAYTSGVSTPLFCRAVPNQWLQLFGEQVRSFLKGEVKWESIMTLCRKKFMQLRY
ncbi:ABC transporter substrate-binding protein [Candidatus Soleaferrea massiliensis]|uniref:ABC transporter substrate-binding protein n=1 Tax=Candidatus Soleaferrea massiliensis TaxID=1470354 RepID=UPI00058CEC31|nr:ABC transporter substrate-binding protein [Candidatus Soleaferrea massiliensis]